MATPDPLVDSIQRLHENIRALEEQQSRLGVLKKPPYIQDQDAEKALKKIDEFDNHSYLLRTTDDFFQMLCYVHEKSSDMYSALAMRLARTEGKTTYFPTERIDKIAKDALAALLVAYGPYIDIEFFIYLFNAKVISLRLHNTGYRSKDDEFRDAVITALLSTGLITKQRAAEILQHI